MSKIGKLPIILPDGVTVEVNGNSVVVVGPKGKLERKFAKEIEIKQKDNLLFLTPKRKSASLSAIYGTTRSLLANMVIGVSQGWSKELELVGAGYKTEVQGKTLVLNVGYSHPVEIEAPEGIGFKTEKTFVTVEGMDKEKVGEVAAKIRGIRPPEPYKGKGIKYKDEVIRRKAGKAAKTVGGTA